MKTSKNINLIAFTSLILCSSCNQNSSKNYEERIADIMPQIITIEDYNRESVIHFSDFADSIEYVPLDDCPDAIISHVDKIEVTCNGDYLVFDDKLRKIVRFDSLGNFLNIIGELGHGPNELVHPITFTYNRYSDHVFVNDNGSLTLLEYDLEGKILNRKRPVPFDAWEMGIIDESHYCFYSDFSSDKPFYNYHITDSSFNTVGVFEKVQDINVLNLGAIVFMNCKSSLLCRSPRSNYLYKLESDSVFPLYQIEHTGSINWLSEKDAYRLRCEYENCSSFCRETFVADNYIFIYNSILDSEQLGSELSVFNFETQKILTGAIALNDLIYPCAASSSIHAVHENKLLSVCFPEDFERLIDGFHSQIDYSDFLLLSLEKIDSLQTIISRFTPFAQRKNAIIQISYLK